MNGQPWFDIAMDKLGIKETPGAAATPEIIEFHQHTTLKATSDEVPWCSAFVNYCMDEAGITGTGSAAARSWLGWGKPINIPIQGCIVILKRGNNPVQGHVGFYAGESSGTVRILGGNQGDRVCYSRFAKADVLGYRWPL